MRKEVFENATLYCGDCLEVLPELADVGAIITDPPYSSGGMRAAERKAPTSQKYQSSGLKKYFADFEGDNRDQRSWTYWMSMWLGIALRVSRPGAMVCLFSDWRQIPAASDALQCAGAVWRGIVVWDKKAGRPTPDRFRNQAEYILWGTNGARKADFKDSGAIYLPGVFQHTSPVSHERKHSTQKPIVLMQDILGITKPDEIVLDPFMGSGTTGAACIEIGRRFIGIEVSEKYFDIACKRISEAVKQKELFREEQLND
jgi:site-specific DNA-methyltransferase (adenine-specific)